MNQPAYGRNNWRDHCVMLNSRAGEKDRSMLTNVMRWLGRRFVGHELPAEEFRADRMDAAWQPEYRQLGGHERPVHVQALQPFHR